MTVLCFSARKYNCTIIIPVRSSEILYKLIQMMVSAALTPHIDTYYMDRVIIVDTEHSAPTVAWLLAGSNVI